MRRRLLYAGLLMTTMLWGGSFAAIKRALQYLAPFELILMRFLPASIVFAFGLAFVDRSAVRDMIKKEWLLLGVMGLTGIVCYNWALNTGEQSIPAGTASLLVALNPIFVFALSAVFLGERVAWWRIMGLLVALAGLFVGIRFGSGRALDFGYLRGVFITILAPLSWSIYSVVGRSLSRRYSPFTVTSVTTIVGTLPLLTMADGPLLDKLWMMPWDVWASLAYLALGCTVVGLTVWSTALRTLGASRAAGFIYLVPMWGVGLGAVLLNEPVTWALVSGAAIVVAGVALVSS
ncbi:MAG TPA: DMT family transporter [Anaerolineae bacterium]|nr:DMT family transporter [Anaerolineae bacterium]